ncbi:hypothetical protein Y032_0352g3272 [Ancylostoma ceylanicum]|uniref:Uncharacterized protein n=1 Tax=Ancylostoma ceylanicum TaxID=53326 RepID=A0A016RWR6_9BILA|nr:hypothetical protein Y032_0352g3272 [Ancylostoma ceylanicum]
MFQAIEDKNYGEIGSKRDPRRRPRVAVSRKLQVQEKAGDKAMSNSKSSTLPAVFFLRRDRCMNFPQELLRTPPVRQGKNTGKHSALKWNHIITSDAVVWKGGLSYERPSCLLFLIALRLYSIKLHFQNKNHVPLCMYVYKTQQFSWNITSTMSTLHITHADTY